MIRRGWVADSPKIVQLITQHSKFTVSTSTTTDISKQAVVSIVHHIQSSASTCVNVLLSHSVIRFESLATKVAYSLLLGEQTAVIDKHRVQGVR